LAVRQGLVTSSHQWKVSGVEMCKSHVICPN
jgi:hypothetical protein